ncbi:MAG: hypothetical protein A2Z15_05500 [Chloroflexi bacterium RBG_16_50_11]|nr:MAG: hypothetical protein A2Z15_05500 [Chloroflexi bacterium RBG_16_50_11]
MADVFQALALPLVDGAGSFVEQQLGKADDDIQVLAKLVRNFPRPSMLVPRGGGCKSGALALFICHKYYNSR